MQVDPERRSSGSGCKEKRRAVFRHQSGGVLAKAGPNGRDRQEIGQIQRVEKNPTNVPVSVSGKTAAPRLDGVDRFQTTGEPEILDLLHDQSRVFMQSVEILVEADDVARILCELDIAGCRDAHCLLRIVCHGLRVDIDRTVVGLEDLIFEAANSRAPLSARLVQQATRLLRVEENGASAPAILHRQENRFRRGRRESSTSGNHQGRSHGRAFYPPEVQCQRRSPA